MDEFHEILDTNKVATNALECLETLHYGLGHVLGTRKRDLERKQESLVQNAARMARGIREIEDDRRELHKALTEGVPVDQMQAEIERLRAMEKILSVRTVGSTLFLLFGGIECTDPKSRKVYEIGDVEARVGITDGTVVFENKTRRISGAHHPHVYGHACLGNLQGVLPDLYGHACLGNLQGVLPDLVRNGELCAAAAIAIGYLETCNPDDHWGAGVVNWPLKAQAPAAPAPARKRRKKNEGEDSPPQA